MTEFKPEELSILLNGEEVTDFDLQLTRVSDVKILSEKFIEEIEELKPIDTRTEMFMQIIIYFFCKRLGFKRWKIWLLKKMFKMSAYEKPVWRGLK